jgi:hypothetical protein
MKAARWLGTAAFVIGPFLLGCQSSEEKPRASGKAIEQGEAEAEIRTSLAALSPQDRKLAEEQKFCAVESENRLGVMGTPVKVIVNDQPVFLCCKGCRKKALADPEKTLARVRELKSKSAGAPTR